MIDLGAAPVGTIDTAAQKAIDLSETLRQGGWEERVVRLEFNGTLVSARYDDSVADVVRRYREARRLT